MTQENVSTAPRRAVLCSKGELDFVQLCVQLVYVVEDFLHHLLQGGGQWFVSVRLESFLQCCGRQVLKQA